MISEASRKISDYLVSNGAKGNADVLAYGAECFINLLISDGLLIIVGLFTGRVLELLVWAVSYTLLRTNLGGLHASTHFRCIAIGTVIGASSLVLSPLLISFPYFSAPCLLLATVAAVILAPVPHKNKRHVQKQKNKIKLKVAVILLCECALVIAFWFISSTVSAYIASGVIMASALGVLGQFFNPR
jgi:Membrane protein putatively involved in post-translational modification of the autoinducing quorum-sensing peptide